MNLVIVLSERFVIVKVRKFSFVASRFSCNFMRPVCLLSLVASLAQSKSILHHMFDFWSPKAPQKSRSHIETSQSRQPSVKGERMLRYEVNVVMITIPWAQYYC